MSRPSLVRRVQEGALYVLLVLLPFSKAAVEVIFGVLLCAWVWERCHPSTRWETVWLRPRLRDLTLAIVVFLAACACSIVGSDAPRLSLRAFFSKWLEYLLYFVIVADVASRPGVAKRCLMVFIYASLFVFFEAITQERSGFGFFMRHRLDYFGRMTGPYENPIDLGTYLMMVILTAIPYAFVRLSVTRWPLWALLVILALCLSRTMSLGAVLGLGTGLLTIGVRNATVRRAALAAFAVVVVVCGVFLWRTGRISRLYSMSDIGKRDRVLIWQAALGMIRDRPLVGHGVNTFMANYLDYWVGGEHQPRYAHNCYLQMAAETGLVGLLAFLWLLWCLFARLVVGIRPARSDDGVLLLGCLAALLAFAVQAGVDTNFYALRQVALFWVVAGLAVGLNQSREAQATPEDARSSRPIEEAALVEPPGHAQGSTSVVLRLAPLARLVPSTALGARQDDPSTRVGRHPERGAPPPQAVGPSRGVVTDGDRSPRTTGGPACEDGPHPDKLERGKAVVRGSPLGVPSPPPT